MNRFQVGMPGFGGEFKEHTWEQVWEVCVCVRESVSDCVCGVCVCVSVCVCVMYACKSESLAGCVYVVYVCMCVIVCARAYAQYGTRSTLISTNLSLNPQPKPSTWTLIRNLEPKPTQGPDDEPEEDKLRDPETGNSQTLT